MIETHQVADQTNKVLKDIMTQLPADEFSQFIGGLPDDFFHLEDMQRRNILKQVRHAIIHDGLRDHDRLIKIVRAKRIIFISENY